MKFGVIKKFMQKTSRRLKIMDFILEYFTWYKKRNFFECFVNFLSGGKIIKNREKPRFSM